MTKKRKKKQQRKSKQQNSMSSTSGPRPEHRPNDLPGTAEGLTAIRTEPSHISGQQLPDLDKLRISQDFANDSLTTKVEAAPLVRKPHGQEFIRVHSQPEWQLHTFVFKVTEDDSFFIVDKSLAPELMGEAGFALRIILTCVTRSGEVFLWPVEVPDGDGANKAYATSALEAAEAAKEGWVRMRWDRGSRSYVHTRAKADFGDPRWPCLPFDKLLQLAFLDRYIGDRDHITLKRLRGES
jgi:hypothetical protein